MGGGGEGGFFDVPDVDGGPSEDEYPRHLLELSHLGHSLVQHSAPCIGGCFWWGLSIATALLITPVFVVTDGFCDDFIENVLEITSCSTGYRVGKPLRAWSAILRILGSTGTLHAAYVKKSLRCHRNSNEKVPNLLKILTIFRLTLRFWLTSEPNSHKMKLKS